MQPHAREASGMIDHDLRLVNPQRRGPLTRCDSDFESGCHDHNLNDTVTVTVAAPRPVRLGVTVRVGSRQWHRLGGVGG